LNKRTYKIGELSTLLKRGITPSYTDEHLVKVVNQKCIRGFQINLDLARYTDPVKKKVSDEKYLENFDVLVNSTGVGTLGRVAQIFEINQPITADSHVTIIRPNQKIVDPLYFGYYMKSIQKNIEMLGEGSTGQTELSRVLLSDLEIDIIENIQKQRIVSEFLKVIDKKIELNKKMNENLEEISKTLFKSWFIGFDPVRAKTEGRPTGLSKEISDLFPDSFEDSELGAIPKGWKVGKIGTYFDVLLGGTPSRKKEEYWNGDIPWINSGEINNFRVISHSELITKSGFENSSTKLMPKRSTLIAITGATLGQVSLNEIEVCANQSVIGISPATSIFPEYVYLWINFTIKKLISSQTGGAQQHINTGNVKDHLIMIPDENISTYLISFFESIFDKISANLFETQTLISLRDTLLPKLISGELKVSDVENVIEKATSK